MTNFLYILYFLRLKRDLDITEGKGMIILEFFFVEIINFFNDDYFSSLPFLFSMSHSTTIEID